jgi:hypothetical protein
MRRLCLLFAFLPLLLAPALPARAIEVVEAWRTPFGTIRGTAVNSTDGSVWMSAGASVMHLASDGSLLSQTDGFVGPRAVSVNSADGSCWVGVEGATDSLGRWEAVCVAHLAEDGTELLRLTGLTGPFSLSVNPSDNSLWVVAAEGLVQFSAEGTELSRAPGYSGAVAVNSTDGSVWVNAGGDLVHLSATGTELGRGVGLAATSLSVNQANGSCWAIVGNAEDAVHLVVHLAADGTELWRRYVLGTLIFWRGQALSPVCADGSCWAIEQQYDPPGPGPAYGPTYAAAVHLSEDNAELARVALSGPAYPHPMLSAIAALPSDGSCWVIARYGDLMTTEVLHLSASGTELWRGAANGYVGPISVDPTDGSAWTNAYRDLVHLSATGVELWRRPGLTALADAVVTSDGSAWAWEQTNGDLVHLSASGIELGRGVGISPPAPPLGTLIGPASVSVNPTDGSCWAVDPVSAEVVHLGPDGTELWRGGGFLTVPSVTVSPADGSCWVWATDRSTSPATNQLVHLGANGTELWRTAVLDCCLRYLAVNPRDGSCWLKYEAESPWDTFVHLSAEHAELGRGGGDFETNLELSVNPADGSVWAASLGAIHLAADGTQLWRYVPVGEQDDFFWGALVNPNDGSWWTYGTRFGGRLVLLGADGAELWRSEPGFGGGVNALSPYDGSVWVTDGRWQSTSWGFVYVDFEANAQIARLTQPAVFYDVPWYHWAFAQVGACYRANIVQGYPDGTYRPTQPVDRGQMAIYISRGLVAPSGDAAIPPGPPEATFSDVPTDHWAFKWVEYAVAQNIVGGYGDGTYRPTNPVDRGQMAVFVARSIVTPHGDEGLVGYAPPETPTFSDVATDHWAYKYIEYIAQDSVAVSQGYGDGTYRPAVTVTRDQMAVYVQRAFNLPM